MGRMALIAFFRGINVGGHRAFRPSVLAKELPEGGEWLVRIIAAKDRLVYGVYRRHMKTIGCLGQIDRLFGASATTRSWNTILSVLRILKSHESGR
jgi:uncharacterized protein (DUF1697 family)